LLPRNQPGICHTHLTGAESVDTDLPDWKKSVLESTRFFLRGRSIGIVNDPGIIDTTGEFRSALLGVQSKYFWLTSPRIFPTSACLFPPAFIHDRTLQNRASSYPEILVFGLRVSLTGESNLMGGGGCPRSTEPQNTGSSLRQPMGATTGIDSHCFFSFSGSPMSVSSWKRGRATSGGGDKGKHVMEKSNEVGFLR